MFSACSQKIIPKNNNVSSALQNFKNDILLKNASVSFYAKDINSGNVIAELNPDMGVVPASTLKLFTSATALEVLGRDFKFKTGLEYIGEIDSTTKTLNGYIIIRGGADPTLGSKYFAETRHVAFIDNWVLEIKKLGIENISGGVIADARIFSYDIVPPTWAWEDMGNYFGAGPNGLSIMDNLYTITYNTGDKIGDTCSITDIYPEIPEMKIESTVTASNVNSDMSYIFGSPYTYFRYIRGELPIGKASYQVKGSMPDPALFAAQLLSKKLSESGINIANKATTYRISPYLISNSAKTVIISQNYSVSLESIIKVLNYKSINLFAEHLLLQIGLNMKSTSDTKNSAMLLSEFWKKKGMDTDGLSVNDGSGLSRYNRVTAKQTVFLLEYMKKKSANSEVFFSTLPIAGKNGTLSYFGKNTALEGNMRAKSGSIRDITAYGGYLTTKSGREIAFYINVNNYNGEGYLIRNKMAELLTALADFEY